MNAEFFAAVRAGDSAAVTRMLDNDVSLLEARDENGLGAYTVARYSRYPEIASLLLERGASLDIFAAVMAGVESRVIDLLGAERALVNSYSHDGWTPLHLAAFFGQPVIAEILLASGADVHARSQNGMGNTPLHAAVAGRSVDAVRILLAHAADVNARQQGGWTALHAAAQNGDAAMVEFLISHGADAGARADNGQNASDLALTGGHADVAQLLELRGAQ